MTSTATRRHAAHRSTPVDPHGLGYRPGPLGRLGVWVTHHRRLGVAVLLDAFLVRLVLLPVMLRLTGNAAWWSPRWLTRLLPRTTFSHG